MNSGLHPLAVPFPPLQRVGLFAASSVRALAEFAAVNAAARECVTCMAVRDRALPGALRNGIARGCEHTAMTFARQFSDEAAGQRDSGADRAAIKCAWECEALADALVPAAQQLGVDAAQVELLIAFRDVGNLPASWALATPLAQWVDVTLNEQRTVSKICPGATPTTPAQTALLLVGFLQLNPLTGHVDLTALPATLTTLILNNNALSGAADLSRLPATLTALVLNNNQLTGAVDLTKLPASLTVVNLTENELTGAVDLTKLPATLTRLCLGQNKLTGAIDLTKLPASLKTLHLHENQLTGLADLTKLPASLSELCLQYNAGLTGVWRGTNPKRFDFTGTRIVRALCPECACVIA